MALTVASLVASTGVAQATTVAASAPRAAAATPFSCTDTTVFLSQNTPTVLESETFALGEPASFSDVGTASGWKYNGIAFDSQDDFIYGASLTSGNPQLPGDHLLKIDSTGAVTDLGLFPDRLEGQTAGWVAATFDQTPGAADAGIYYATNPGVVPSSDLYELPITAGKPGTARNLTLTSGGNTVTPELDDITYSDGFLWGIDENSGDQQIDRIDPTNGDLTAVTQTALPTAGADPYGAAWTLGNGDIGFSDNDTGDVYTIAIHDAAGTPAFSLVSTSTGPSSPVNSDGTACAGENADLGIVKSATATVAPGGALSYSLLVTNHGPGTSSGYTVVDDVPKAVTKVKTSTAGCTVSGNDVSCEEGPLADGGSFTVTITGVAPSTAGRVTNTATVTGDEVDPKQSNNSSSATTFVGSPDVTLTKSVSSSTPSFGGSDTFTLTATNSGPVAAGKVVVTDKLASGLEYDSSTASAGSVSVSGQTVTWTIPNLAALGGDPAAATLSIVVTVDTISALTNTATFTEQVPGPSNTTTGTSDTVSLTAQSAVLDLTNTLDDTTPTSGSSVTYTIVVSNAGPDGAQGVVVEDALPAGLSYVSAAAPAGASTAPSVSASGVVTWDVGTLALDATATLEIVAKVTAASGTIVDTASATSTTYDPDGQTRQATASLVVSSGEVVPPTHTGEPWSGGDYWLLVGGMGAGGMALVQVGRRRRRRRPLHAAR